MGKDLTEPHRKYVEDMAAGLIAVLSGDGQSLGIARECLINAFDAKAAELDG